MRQDNLTPENRSEIVKLRMEHAETAIKEAKNLMDSEFWNGAVSRLYYAVFYAASALLVKNQIKGTTHAGVKTQIGLHFISKGILPASCGKTLVTLFDLRLDADYDDYIFCDKTMVEELYPSAIEFVNTIKKLL